MRIDTVNPGTASPIGKALLSVRGLTLKLMGNRLMASTRTAHRPLRRSAKAALNATGVCLALLAPLAEAAMQEDAPPTPPRDGRPHHPPPDDPDRLDAGRPPHGPFDDHPRRPDRPGSRPLDRMGDPEGRGPMSLFARLTPREKQEMETFLREHFPRLAEQAERTREVNPQRYLRLMTRLTPEMQGLMDLMANDPERGALMIEERRLDAEIRLVARRARSTDVNQNVPARERLAELVGRLFDVRHQRREMEIRELDARVLELKARHEEATRMRQKSIDRMIEERLEPPDPLEWDEE